MDKKIKQYADSRDLTSLKYIFVDSLDVDPTFETYREAYDYCKAIPGLLEQHRELTPFTSDPAQWTEAYWAKLKMDLKKNFSDQRMTHMRTVAKTFLAEKRQRILQERQALMPLSVAPVAVPASPVKPVAQPTPVRPAPSVAPANVTPKLHSAVSAEEEAQRRVLEETRRQLEAENKRIEEMQAAEERARKAKAEELNRQQPQGDPVSKKAIGIALIAVAAAVILFLLLK